MTARQEFFLGLDRMMDSGVRNGAPFKTLLKVRICSLLPVAAINLILTCQFFSN
jgi:hypothetical protein